MQQHSSHRSSTHGAASPAEMDTLLAELRRVLERIALVGPPETVTVPLALPMDLAELMVHQAEAMGLDTAPIYVSCLLHGQYHAALEGGAPASAQHVAALIRRLAARQEWERFVQQHPEVTEVTEWT